MARNKRVGSFGLEMLLWALKDSSVSAFVLSLGAILEDCSGSF